MGVKRKAKVKMQCTAWVILDESYNGDIEIEDIEDIEDINEFEEIVL